MLKLFSAISNSINLELKTFFATYMCKLCLYRLAHRIFPIESFPNNTLHNGDVPNIPKKTIHLNNIFKSQSHKCKSLFHLIKRTVNLFLNSSTYISDTIT